MIGAANIKKSFGVLSAAEEEGEQIGCYESSENTIIITIYIYTYIYIHIYIRLIPLNASATRGVMRPLYFRNVSRDRCVCVVRASLRRAGVD